LPSKEESIKKSSYIKSNNSSSKFYTRSTSVNNLKYSNFQSIASRIAATKTQSNKNQSSGRLNQNFDESILRPATGNWLSSSSSDAIDLNLSISSFASPNQNQSENQSKGCRSGSAKLIIKVSLYVFIFYSDYAYSTMWNPLKIFFKFIFIVCVFEILCNTFIYSLILNESKRIWHLQNFIGIIFNITTNNLKL